MTKWQIRIAALLSIGQLLILPGCAISGKVEQGRVIAYDQKAELVTLIPESRPKTAGVGVLPPLTVKVPADPDEMGPAPAAGKLMQLDAKNRRVVIFDAAAQAFRTIPYTPVAERRNLAKAPSTPAVDRDKKTITVYSSSQKLAVTFAATDEMLAMPADTWKSGDVVRYYYKQPDQALRLMNVTKTDLMKAGG